MNEIEQIYFKYKTKFSNEPNFYCTNQMFSMSSFRLCIDLKLYKQYYVNKDVPTMM